MAARIILVRHAETVANAARLWQGATNTAFSPRGRDQLGRLTTRLGDEPIDLVVSSDLGRAEATAGAFRADFETDPRWREPNVGDWEGLTYEEIRERFPDDLAALLRGEDVSMGGGERLSGVAARLVEAFETIVVRIGDRGTAVVVSHGIALSTLVATLLEARPPAPLALMANTGMTVFEVGDRGPQLVSYNDAAHLGHVTVRPGETHLVLIRHGETAANVELRWQGHSDWPLNPAGEEQATTLAHDLPTLEAVYSSPLRRARTTAEVIARVQGLDVKVDDELKEIGFGGWENMTTHEIADADPTGWERLMAEEDLARGGTGETFRGVRDRMTRTLGAIAGAHRGGVVGVVSHGGATRAFAVGLLGLEFPARHRIRSLGNTAVARIVYSRRGAVIAAWNAAWRLVRPA